MLADQGQVPHTIDTDVHSTVHLPDSFALGLAYRPLENLSFEVGTVFTRWSTYDSMNIYCPTQGGVKPPPLGGGFSVSFVVCGHEQLS